MIGPLFWGDDVIMQLRVVALHIASALDISGDRQLSAIESEIDTPVHGIGIKLWPSFCVYAEISQLPYRRKLILSPVDR